jgi:NadR type nicotinamide-nucleotide adenylyltransferase
MEPSSKTTGLIIGKFMPPHFGHLHLVEYARSRVDHLAIIIFSKSHEPIPGPLRTEWMRKLCPDTEIIHVEEEHPVDFYSLAAWDLWTATIRKVYPSGPDIVFSSEGYGNRLAQSLGAKHVLVDLDRLAVPVSATKIRDDPMTNWDFIPSVARPFFVKRVCLIGAESTGKTTMARSLASHFNTTWAPEFARQYLLPKNWVCLWDDMIAIAEGQGRLEDEMAERANRVLLCDTDQVTTSIWCERYFNKCDERILRLAAGRKYDLYFLCDIDMPWFDDGTRDSREWRNWFHQKFLDSLTSRGVPFIILSGNFEARMRRAVEEVSRLVGS